MEHPTRAGAVPVGFSCPPRHSAGVSDRLGMARALRPSRRVSGSAMSPLELLPVETPPGTRLILESAASFAPSNGSAMPTSAASSSLVGLPRLSGT